MKVSSYLDLLDDHHVTNESFCCSQISKKYANGFDQPNIFVSFYNWIDNYLAVQLDYKWPLTFRYNEK